MKQKSANKLMWVESWLERFSSPKDETEVTADQTKDGKWKCEIQLPLVNQTVTIVDDTEVGALYKASSEAAKLIDEYLINHPELEIKNKYKRHHYVFEEDENGRFKSVHLTTEYCQKEGRKMMNMMSKSVKAIEKAISDIKRIYGLDNGILIQVFDKSLFNNKTREEISNQVYDILMKEYSVTLSMSTVIVKDDHVIVMGYANKLDFITREEAEHLC